MLSCNELFEIKGGAFSLSATLLNSIARIITTILDLGRTVGSSVSRYKNRNYCS